MIDMRRAACLVLCAALAAACNLSDAEPGLQAMQWQGELQPQPGWVLVGTAGMVTAVGAAQFTAELQIRGGGIPETIRPWAVHQGTCATGGPVLGSPDHYPLLTVNAEGEAFSSAVVPGLLDPESQYHANVYESEEEPDVVIACADLILIGST